MSFPLRRAVLLSACAAPSELARRAAQLSRVYDELIVGLDEARGESELAPMPERWAALRSQLAPCANVAVTPLARTPGLDDVFEQAAALPARLGAFDKLYTDEARWLAPARTLGFPAELLAPDAPEAAGDRNATASSHARRALVVTRAQPFHFGHLALVEHALSLADEVIVIVAAAERSHAARDPFTAGERLALVRAALSHVRGRVWLLALPAPVWPASALRQLSCWAPEYATVVGHNPVLRGMAEELGKQTAGLPEPYAVKGQVVSASLIRARLVREGAGPWLQSYVPEAVAERLRREPAWAQRCAQIAAAGD